MLGLIRQMGVSDRSKNRVMPENMLDFEKVDAALD